MARLRARSKSGISHECGSYSLRKRRSDALETEPLQQLLSKIKNCHNVVIFTGSGLSAASGMSTFTSKGGLYERAKKRFKVSDGKKLFCYSFFERQKTEAQAFYAEIYKEARSATPGQGHEAIRLMEESGKLVRHYTLNVDGLAELAGCSTWHPNNKPEGKTVEMHGSITQLVCLNEDCKLVLDMDEPMMNNLAAKKDIACPHCQHPSMRCRIMLYDDKEGDFITPDDVFEVLEEDVRQADVVLWVGISFEQSASTQYFRKVREFLLRAQHWKECTQAVINLSEEAHFNLISACNNIDDVEVLDVRGPSDEVLSEIALELSGKTVELRNKRIRSSDASADLNSLSSEMRSSINTPSTPPSSGQPSGNTDSPSLESKMLASVHMTG